MISEMQSRRTPSFALIWVYLISREDNKFRLDFKTLEEIQDPEKLCGMLFENLSGKLNDLALRPKPL